MKRNFIKHSALFLSLFFFLTALYSAMDFEKEINRLAKEIADKIAVKGKKKIAVVDFIDTEKKITKLGRFLAEEFSVALAGSGKDFTVVDRNHIETLLKEHQLASTGIVDQDTARELGKIAGVGALITGSLTPLGESIRINVKVLDTETAVLIDATSGNIAMTEAIRGLFETRIETTSTSGVVNYGPQSDSRVKVHPVRTVEEGGFVFQAIDCKRKGKDVTCSVLITNKEEDRELTIYTSNTVLNDDFGNQYPLKKIQSGADILAYSSFTKRFFSSVPTKVLLSFENILPQAQMASALVLYVYTVLDGMGKEYAVKLRNIPLTK